MAALDSDQFIVKHPKDGKTGRLQKASLTIFANIPMVDVLHKKLTGTLTATSKNITSKVEHINSSVDKVTSAYHGISEMIKQLSANDQEFPEQSEKSKNLSSSFNL